MNYNDLYDLEQDVNESGGGGQYDTTISATNNIPIGMAGPKGKPPQYKGKIRKGGSKPAKPGKPVLPKSPRSLTDDPEYSNPSNG